MNISIIQHQPTGCWSSPHRPSRAEALGFGDTPTVFQFGVVARDIVLKGWMKHGVNLKHDSPNKNMAVFGKSSPNSLISGEWRWFNQVYYDITYISYTWYAKVSNHKVLNNCFRSDIQTLNTYIKKTKPKDNEPIFNQQHVKQLWWSILQRFQLVIRLCGNNNPVDWCVRPTWKKLNQRDLNINWTPVIKVVPPKL